jgi:hypothetical protein
MALYELQITAPKLLLALELCDKADMSQRMAGMDQVRLAMHDFHNTWDHLMEVYGKTRFIAYPAGYVPDRYFHLASQREDLSWMIQAEEMFHGMIDNWLVSQAE